MVCCLSGSVTPADAEGEECVESELEPKPQAGTLNIELLSERALS